MHPPVAGSPASSAAVRAGRSGVADLGDRQAPGLWAATVAFVLMAWGLGRPALWMDESASAVATQRSWRHLWLLLQGTDAPLVPYYAVLKAQKAVLVHFFPSVQANPEVLLRWPSAIAVVVAVWVLVSWLRSAGSGTVAACSGAVLLLIEGVSRYGQEARPYALVLMMAIVTTAVWWRLMRTLSPRGIAAYAGCVAVLVCLHALAAPLVLAHLMAALLIRGDDLFLRVLCSLCGAMTGLLVASPLTFTAILEGGGASRYQQLSGPHLLDAFASLFTGGSRTDPRFLIVPAMALIGLTRWNSPRHGDLTRVAACWAIVPTLVLVPAVTLRPNLLLARYVLFVIPGWAVLAGLGLSVLAETAARAIEAGGYRAPIVRGVLTCGVLALGVVLLAAVQWPALAHLRTPAGHGESILPVLAQADRPVYAGLPIAVWSQYGAIEVGAYAPAQARRMLNLRPQTDLLDIWPEALAGPLIRQRLLAEPVVILLTRNGRCGSIPSFLKGYQVRETTFTPDHWTFYLLQRVGTYAAAGTPAPGVAGSLLPCTEL